MGWIITPREPLSLTVEVFDVRADRPELKTAGDFAHVPVLWGNQQLPLGELFSITEDSGPTDHITWTGDSSRVKGIGAGQTAGTVVVTGSAGKHAGAQMRGGTLTIHGDAGDWAGTEMHGGLIKINGHAGNQLGAVYRGGHKGMTGGEIIVDGNAGDETGAGMRRGVIAVAGHVGNCTGWGMLAGTIIAGTISGTWTGSGMRRGTIVTMSTANPSPLPPVFKQATPVAPLFLQLYWKRLAQLGFASLMPSPTCRFDRYCGDILELGKGEVFLATG